MFLHVFYVFEFFYKKGDFFLDQIKEIVDNRPGNLDIAEKNTHWKAINRKKITHVFTCLLCLWIFLCFLALLNKTRSATSTLRREWLWRGNKSSKRTLFQLYQKIIPIVCKYCLKYLSGIPIYTPKRSMSSMSFIFFIFIECQLHKHICLIICFLV